MPQELKSEAEGLKSLETFIRKVGDNESGLIKVLYEAQHIFGYLPKNVMLFIGEKMNIPAAKIYGVVSFYSYFNTEPKGRCQFKVCMGTACFVRGSEKILRKLESELGIKVGETSADGKYSLEQLRCLGACGLAPVILVDEDVHGRLTEGDISKIIAGYDDGKGAANA